MSSEPGYEREDGCTCPWGPEVQCCNGTVYGYCEHPQCGGGCEDVGQCPCPLHDTREGHDALAAGEVTER